ncbi:MAG: hypothetical protein FOGNACKC_00925 [Anaerolineae bacterium]|nr:hypothetical protein [Anaerolineae bacterium]
MSDQLMLEAELSLMEAELTLASVKANPYHDPKDGKFSTRAGGAAYGWLTPEQRSARLPKAKRAAAAGQKPDISPKPAGPKLSAYEQTVVDVFSQKYGVSSDEFGKVQRAVKTGKMLSGMKQTKSKLSETIYEKPLGDGKLMLMVSIDDVVLKRKYSDKMATGSRVTGSVGVQYVKPGDTPKSYNYVPLVKLQTTTARYSNPYEMQAKLKKELAKWGM